jgi:flagellar protein FlaJ
MASERYPIDGIAYQLFSGYSSRNHPAYFDLEMNLRKANINVPLDIYVSRTLFISLMAAVAVAGSMLATLALVALTSYSGTFLPWEPVTEGSLLAQVASSPWFFAIAVTTAAFLATYVSSYMLYRNYPYYRANVRESNINQMLPHTVTFMYAMSNGGMNLLEIFRTINEHSDIYGEVAVELETVVRGVDLLGLDLISSIKQASLLTASEPLRNFFDSLATNMESGGDLANFLRSRSDQFQVVASQERKALLDMLSMLAEVYVTAFVAGPLFLITILISLGMITSGDMRQIEILIYLLIPVGSLLFVWVLTTLGFGSLDDRARELKRELDEFKEVRVVPASTSFAVSKAIQRAELRYTVKKFIDNPTHVFMNRPTSVLYVTVPVAAIVFIALAWPQFTLPSLTNPGTPSYGFISRIDDLLLLALAIALLPFIAFWEARSRRIRKMDAAIPEFLKRLASYNESGLTLTLAIKSLLNSNLGVLTSEIRKIWSDIEWGAETKDALMRFEYRVNTAAIRRVVTLITKASESSGDIKETLSIAAADAAASQSDREERVLNMLLYVSIIYISFFVFLYIIYVLVTVFLPMVPGQSFSMQMPGTSSNSMTLAGTVDLDDYRLIFLHAVLIQGLFSGIVAGMMGEGNLYSGLKHSAIMMLIGYVIFALLL